MSRQTAATTTIARASLGLALTFFSCTGEPVQQGDLLDHTDDYQVIDLLHLDIELKSPESIAVDEATGCYFISNVNEASDPVNDDGFIIKLDSNLSLIDNFFIDGHRGDIVLNDPRGMVVNQGILYVCDLNMVRAFSTATGAHQFDIDFTPEGASFLNGIAADTTGNLFVSDTYQHRIYRIDTGRNISVYAEVSYPNGLCVGPDGALYVVTWETGKRLVVLDNARVFKIHSDGRSEAMWFTTKFENLDGIDFDAYGRMIFSDYGRGAVYAFDMISGELAKVFVTSGTPAGIACDCRRNLILIPNLQGELVFLRRD